MRQFLFFVALLSFFLSCKIDKKEENAELKTYKQKLSYLMGGEQANWVTESGDPNFDRLDKEEIVRNFEKGFRLKEPMTPDCKTALEKLYGKYGGEFDSTYLKKGCACIGQMAGSIFYNTWKKKEVLDQIDLKTAIIGFEHGIFKKDTLINPDISNQVVTDFMTLINKKSGKKMMQMASKLPNAQTIEGGIVIETLQKGIGESPTETSDVKVNYILQNASGDTIENSFIIEKESGQPTPAFNLTGVIKGWGMAFPKLQKGGKYNLYIPWALAYGEKNQCESLKFYIELIDYGQRGTLLELDPQLKGIQ